MKEQDWPTEILKNLEAYNLLHVDMCSDNDKTYLIHLLNEPTQIPKATNPKIWAALKPDPPAFSGRPSGKV